MFFGLSDSPNLGSPGGVTHPSAFGVVTLGIGKQSGPIPDTAGMSFRINPVSRSKEGYGPEPSVGLGD